VPRPATQDGKSKTLSLKVSAATVDAIEAARGEMPVSAWLHEAIDDKLRRAAWVAAGGGEPAAVPAGSGIPKPRRGRSRIPEPEPSAASTRDLIRSLPSMR
jgi:hypothetical protein